MGLFFTVLGNIPGFLGASSGGLLRNWNEIKFCYYLKHLVIFFSFLLGSGPTSIAFAACSFVSNSTKANPFGSPVDL